jgi:hypothetical protein
MAKEKTKTEEKIEKEYIIPLRQGFKKNQDRQISQ